MIVTFVTPKYEGATHSRTHHNVSALPRTGDWVILDSTLPAFEVQTVVHNLAVNPPTITVTLK